MTGKPTPKSRQAQRYSVRQRSRRRLLSIGLGIAVVVVVLATVGLINYHESSVSSAGSSSQTVTSPKTTALPSIGESAPSGTFVTINGQNVTVASLRGTPTLLWFVSTWCSSCEAGTQAMAQNLATIAHAGVRVSEIELYHDLGSQGPSMFSFAKELAGTQYNNPDWTFGISSLGLTKNYDPVGYLDVYYLVNSEGKITYVNSSPAATMPELLKAISRI